MKRQFGHISGIAVGDHFTNRIELSLAGIHRPRQAGISGSQNEGADSIVVSGGYADDRDYGDEIIYTGHGGRDATTGKQVTDQELIRGNLALALNAVHGLPVRVVRGANQQSSYAPEKGYRYDGLFRVVTYWRDTGEHGYQVWLFHLVQIEDTAGLSKAYEPEAYPQRKETYTQRIVRNTAVGQEIKALYHYQCMVCNQTIPTSAGFYAEAAHIKPLGLPHEGPDIKANLLCLCPNHHVMLDLGGFSITDDYQLLGLKGYLTVHPKHTLDERLLAYHRHHVLD